MMSTVMDSTNAVIPPEAMSGLFVGADLIALLIMLTIDLLMTIALFYGIPLIILNGQNT
jgi:hypothetical protein